MHQNPLVELEKRIINIVRVCEDNQFLVPEKQDDASLRLFLTDCLRASAYGTYFGNKPDALSKILLAELSRKENKRLKTAIKELSDTTFAQKEHIKKLRQQIEESTEVSKRQLDAIDKLFTVSQNQLETSNAIVAEARATSAEARSTTKLSRILVALTGVLAIQTSFLVVDAIDKIGIVRSGVIFLTVAFCIIVLSWSDIKAAFSRIFGSQSNPRL